MRDARALTTLTFTVGFLGMLLPTAFLCWGVPVDTASSRAEVVHDRPHLRKATFDRDYELVWFREYGGELWVLPESEAAFYTHAAGFIRIDPDGMVHDPHLRSEGSPLHLGRSYWARETPVVYETGGRFVDFGTSPPTRERPILREVADLDGFRDLHARADRVVYFGNVAGEAPFALTRLEGDWWRVPLPEGAVLEGPARGPNTFAGLGQKSERPVPMEEPFVGNEAIASHDSRRRGRVGHMPAEDPGRSGWFALSGPDDVGTLVGDRFVYVRRREGGVNWGTVRWEPVELLPFGWTQRYLGESELTLTLNGATLRFWEEGERSKFGWWHTSVLWYQAPMALREEVPLSFLKTPSGVYLIRPIQ